MLVPDCIVLSLILVEKKTNDTCIHIHTVAVSTWSHVWRVEKIAYATPKQAPKNVAATKSNRPNCRHVAPYKPPSPTQREKTKIGFSIHQTPFLRSLCEVLTLGIAA